MAHQKEPFKPYTWNDEAQSDWEFIFWLMLTVGILVILVLALFRSRNTFKRLTMTRTQNQTELRAALRNKDPEAVTSTNTVTYIIY